MSVTQLLDEVKLLSPAEKWQVVEALLKDLQAEHGVTSGVIKHSYPTIPAERFLTLTSIADLEGDALEDTERLYDGA